MVVRVEAQLAELQADVSFANSLLVALDPVRFLVTDHEAASRAAALVHESFRQAAPRFEECCQKMTKDTT